MQHYRDALRIIEPESPSWRPPVLAVSALTGAGLPELWQEIGRHRESLEATGELAAKRRRQQVAWMWSMLEDPLGLGERGRRSCRSWSGRWRKAG